MAGLFRGASHAVAYSAFRFSPPSALVESVIQYLKEKISPPFRKAIDVGCGSGQSTIVLAPYFENVIGLDVSESQIENAMKVRGAPNITYRVSEACHVEVDDSSVELVTVGQALHWFDIEDFFTEAKRILVPNGTLAAYGYWIPVPKTEDNQKSEMLSVLIKQYLHDDILGEYWDKRRYNVLRYSYSDVVLPLNDPVRKAFTLQSSYTVSDYVGYLTSWSAYQELRKENKQRAESLLAEIQDRIMEILEAKTPAEQTDLSVFTNFFLLLGRKPPVAA